MANQPEYGGGAGYLAILVREAEGSQWSYDLSFGDRPQGAQTRREYLVAYAIFDLTPQPAGGGRRSAPLISPLGRRARSRLRSSSGDHSASIDHRRSRRHTPSPIRRTPWPIV
jgi:hypothetical protein